MAKGIPGEGVRITIPLPPVSKKNSPRIMRRRDGSPFVMPSDKYREYEKKCGWFMPKAGGWNTGVNVRCVFYMPTRRRVDLVNLEEAVLDVLVHYGVIEDDNSRIVRSMDGSRVEYDRENPRTEITITKAGDE